ncbi:ATP-dependent Clp protease adaptor protein ClpS [Brevibacterium paucivorans]|uniref:ATP-dependent Clp protease adapter protein ClpS n=1 Tax=Brevibacterium paucivorans TaxID=170994 RepID=A0ABS2SJU7_9MICO|nr:ATP-dependent Clp protease adapter ClpS [Brevibacterium paucivorans]MBM7815864.1 ATP-dependent Clp protease adaptor protein ClpS [Brevibacterium paucivorans]
MSTLAEPEVDEVVATDSPWVTIVFSDPVNLMSYVTYVFRSYFGYSPAKAKKLMMEVHNEGKSVVATGTREQMERDTAAMHGFGLWATCKKADA